MKEKTLQQRATLIQLVILDVDGVMTDNHITLNSNGEEMKSFHVKDGFGIKLLRDAGIQVIIISGRRSKAVEKRAQELGIDEVHLGIEDKKSLCQQLIERSGMYREHICCIGDDLPDLPLFACVGLPIAVNDAVKEVQKRAVYITTQKGGKGAVREVCELILKAKGLWDHVMDGYGRDINLSLHDR